MNFRKISSIRKICQTTKVYNFSVPKYESYIANGFIVHNCQNWKVSQSTDAKTKDISPLELAQMAKDRGTSGVCLTYNEPTVYAEYVVELGEILKEMQMPLVIKTNGFVNSEAWKDICQVTTAMNIDHKGNRPRYIDAGVELPYYEDIELFMVDQIRSAMSYGVHVEVSLPIHSDDWNNYFGDIRDGLASVSNTLPVHLLKIFPAYNNKNDTTSSDLINKIREEMQRYGQLKYVYTNLNSNTVCYNCRDTVVSRSGFSITKHDIEWCPECNRLQEEMLRCQR